MPQQFSNDKNPSGFGRNRKLGNSINWHKLSDWLHCPWCAAKGVIKEGMTHCPECQQPVAVKTKIVTLYRAERA